MTGNLGVSPAKLQETVNVLLEQKMVMQGKLNNISEAITNLRSNWDSPASAQLQNIAATMQLRFDELEKDVNCFADYLTEVIKNYDVTEEEAGSILANVLGKFD